MKPLRFAPTANRELLGAWQFAAHEYGAQAADRLIDRIGVKLDLIANHPQVGALVETQTVGIRCIAARPYVIYYRDELEEVPVVRILHGSRDHGPLLE